MRKVTLNNYHDQKSQLTFAYETTESPFGRCFIALTNVGLCQLSFFDSQEDLQQIETEFHAHWQPGVYKIDKLKIDQIAKEIFHSTSVKPIQVLIKGSPFQIKVWQALLTIPHGQCVSYQDIANEIEKPKAVRAAASAIAKNQIAYLIPCHRVVRKNGDLGQYSCGAHRKKELIRWEQKH